MSSITDSHALNDQDALSRRHDMNADIGYAADVAQARREERSSYKRIWALVFCIFLLVSLMARFLPRDWRPSEFGHSGRSILADARAAANQTVPYIFHGLTVMTRTARMVRATQLPMRPRPLRGSPPRGKIAVTAGRQKRR